MTFSFQKLNLNYEFFPSLWLLVPINFGILLNLSLLSGYSKSFQSSLTQIFDRHYLSLKSINCDAPQGFVLSPTLFLFFLNEIDLSPHHILVLMLLIPHFFALILQGIQQNSN